MSTTIAMIGVVVAIVLAIALVALRWNRQRTTSLTDLPRSGQRTARRQARDEAARELAREAARRAARERVSRQGDA